MANPFRARRRWLTALTSLPEPCARPSISWWTKAHSANELAARHDIHFFAADNVFSAAKAGEVDARWLPLEAGDPVLVHRRLSRDARGTPLEMSEDRYIADALSIAVPTSGKNNDLSWTTLNRFPWG